MAHAHIIAAPASRRFAEAASFCEITLTEVDISPFAVRSVAPCLGSLTAIPCALACEYDSYSRTCQSVGISDITSFATRRLGTLSICGSLRRAATELRAAACRNSVRKRTSAFTCGHRFAP